MDLPQELPADFRRGLARLKDPEKLQAWVEALTYNPDSSCRSALRVWREKAGHCFEGALLAATALEYHGGKPLLLDLRSERDDDHVVALFRGKRGWGAISKSNTTVLGYRPPVYASVKELAMSYFPFYFNTKGQMSLRAWSGPINLNGRAYRQWNWRTGVEDLIELGYSLNDAPEKEILPKRELLKMARAPKRVSAACFMDSDPNGLFKA